MGIPEFPQPRKPIRPRDFKCECVCIEVQKILDARKQKECQTFMVDHTFPLSLVDINQNPVINNWLPGNDIVCVGAVFKENLKNQIFVIEKPPQEFTVEPLPATKPPAARVTVTVTPGRNPATSTGTCRVKETVLAELENRSPLANPTRAFIHVCPVRFVKRPILFFPDPEQVGLVSVKAESAWEILECAAEQILGVLRVMVTVGAFIIIKTWADAQLVTTAFGECDWELIPPPLGPGPCDEFLQRPFPPFNPAQLEDFFVPDPSQGQIK